jgi:hypothetical protein
VLTLAAEPAEEGALEQFRIKPVGLGLSVLARRCSRDTATLDACITYASMHRDRSHLASQKPSRPASNATTMRSTFSPCPSASFLQRCRSRSSAFSSASTFFKGCRSIPGTMPDTSQLDWLISITATSVRD